MNYGSRSLSLLAVLLFLLLSWLIVPHSTQRRDEQLAQRRFKTSSGAAADSASITRSNDPFSDPSLSEKVSVSF